jgi:integrase/recombinase XerD
VAEREAMNSLHKIVADYLAVRRSLGFKLKGHERFLLDFATYVQKAGSQFITTNLALQWASQSGLSTMTAASRLGIVRGFAEFARAVDPRNEIPSPDLLPYKKIRPLPYIYSRADLGDLMSALHSIPLSFMRSTYSTLFGLLAVTGMRVGEAIALDRSDFTADEGVLTIRRGKFGKSREVPIHGTSQAVLRTYEQERDHLFSRPRSPAFFLSTSGTRLLRQNVSVTFSRALERAGLSERKPRPRIHDLRHSFAVNTLVDWYKAGLNIDAEIPLLSTYLGHVSPSSTYWYLTAIPELGRVAAQRLEQAMGELP